MSDVIIENIPDELKALRQWVMWRKETREGKMTKIPYRPSNAKARSNDPNTWSTFEQCVKLLPRFDGIGIMFANGLIGVDLDRHIEQDQYSAIAESAMSRLDTYWEVSPSGNGLHALLFGVLPTGRRRRDDWRIEMYDHGRFFTVTGNKAIGSSDHVNDCRAAIAELHQVLFPPIEYKPPAPTTPVEIDDQNLLKLAQCRSEFSELWNGNKSRYSNDDSRADYALCKSLAYWTGNDSSRIDRLFRLSSLMRDKWNAPRGSDGSTYGQMTIAAAIAHTSQTYNPHRRMDQIRSSLRDARHEQ